LLTYNCGKAEIAQQRGFSPSTIINHLLELIEMNQPVENQLVLPSAPDCESHEAVGSLTQEYLRTFEKLYLR